MNWQTDMVPIENRLVELITGQEKHGPDLIRQLSDALWAMAKHRWLGLAMAWLAGILGIAVVLSMPVKYEASARIHVDTQTILKPLLEGLAAQPDVEQQVMMLSRTLISRPNVEKLVDRAGLLAGDATPQNRDDLVDMLMKRIQITGIVQSTTMTTRENQYAAARENLYTIVYRDPDPEKAKRIVQTLVSIFIESRLADMRKESEAASKFIDDEIKTYEQKLVSAENRLKEFKLRHMEILAEDGKNAASRLADLGISLSKAKVELREAQDTRAAIQRQMAPEIDTRIGAERQNLELLLRRYTEQHPDVISARRAIAELEGQKGESNLAGGQAADPMASVDKNPVNQHLRITLADAESRVASASARVNEYETRYQQLKDAMRVAPQLEADLAQLNRDYDINKKNYEALMARRESASISRNLDSKGGGDVQLIDPPRATPRPVTPTRAFLSTLALLFSLAVGTFSAYAAGHFRPVFFDSRSLRMATGLPLLGSIELVEGPSDKLRRRVGWALFLTASGGLIAAFAVIAVIPIA